MDTNPVIEHIMTTAATRHKSTEASKDQGLQQLHAAFEPALEQVNHLIIERMQSSVPLIPQLAQYVVAAGGKRLRPLLTLASADLCDYAGDRHYGLAACVEFIHTATLLHDDVVDESAERRGQASANEIFGNKASVLVGDFLFTRAFELMVADGSLEVLRILSKASATIAEGEVMQLNATSDLTTDEATYLEVIRGKTAVLFAAACEVGAVVADQPTKRVADLRNFGENLGMAFQLIDDVLDYSADRRDWGKEIGDDFREGKMTLPVVLSIAAAKQNKAQDELDFWQRTIGDLDQQDSDLDHAIGLMNRHQALTQTRERAEHFANAAIDDLAAFPASHATRSLMINAVRASISRRY